MKEKYTITGMSCASCANHVHQAVSSLKGINECNVNLLLNQMEIDRDEYLSQDAVINAVKESGYGASLYGLHNRNNEDQLKEKRIVLIVSIVLMVLLSYISMYSMFNLPILAVISKEKNPLIHCLTQFILSFTICSLYYKRIFNGLVQLIKGKSTMDSLIALSCIASMLYGLYITVRIIMNPADASALIHHLYFETGAMVLVFSSIGKYMEERSKIKTTSAITDLMAMAPSFAYKQVDGKVKRIKADEIEIGDLLVVKPGSKIAVDGIVTEGCSYLDQSALNGESMPVEKKSGDTVLCGTLNLNGLLMMRATHRYSDSSFSKIIELVSQAASSKAPISRLADRISLIFVPSIIVLSCITTLLWLLSGNDFNTAFSYGMSVLVVSCPCALGLATPTAIMVATGKAAKMGILFKNAGVIEETASIDTLVYDKTNTITTGSMKVQKVEIVKPIDDLYSLLYTLEKASSHPLAQAIIQYCEDNQGIDLGFRSTYTIAKGVSASWQQHIYRCGSAAFMTENGIEVKQETSKEISTLYFAQDTQLICIIEICDSLKPGVKHTLDYLGKYRHILLSGDTKMLAQQIGTEAGFKEIIAEVLPDQKQDVIMQLQNAGHRVAMIGDGINDSIALTQANVGIAINNATDIATKASDIVLISDRIADIANILHLSKLTMRIIRQNLFWALGYNAILIPIASGLFSKVGLHLNPMICSAAMSLSSLTVVSNALRINGYKPFETADEEMCAKYIYTLTIDHMMCEHCQRSVENALLNCNIISSTTLNPSQCTFKCNEKPDFTKIKEEIEKAGYHIANIKETEN